MLCAMGHRTPDDICISRHLAHLLTSGIGLLPPVRCRFRLQWALPRSRNAFEVAKKPGVLYFQASAALAQLVEQRICNP